MRLLLSVLLAIPISAPVYGAAVDGANVHWTSKGKGPAVILVHGWTCDESSWDEQVPVLSQKYHVITLDRQRDVVLERTTNFAASLVAAHAAPDVLRPFAVA